MGFTERAGKQLSECLDGVVETALKPITPSNPVYLGIWLASMQTTPAPNPNQNPSLFGHHQIGNSLRIFQQFLTGFCHWLPRRPISSAPGSTSGTAVGKRENIQDFPKENCGSSCSLSPSPAQELECSWLVLCPKFIVIFTKIPEF